MKNMHPQSSAVRSSNSYARLSAGLIACALAVGLGGLWQSWAQAQAPALPSLVVSRNVNMVSGQQLPDGDPYLQRQNEPSVAASTRNPMHLLAGANDYRTVDIPGNFEDGETGDAWLGLFKSFDGGERWSSTLLPGYPQDTTPDGLASPLKAYHAGADPVVRPGTNGLLYYAGLAFNRGEGAPSAVFVSRFVDNNNKENGDPIGYLSTSIVASSSGGSFLDKPWMAVDVPRAGAKVCQVEYVQPEAEVNEADRQGGKGKKKGKPEPPRGGKKLSGQVLGGTMYVTFASITTTPLPTGESDVVSRIMLSRSEDCGATWTTPVQISRPEDPVNQGATIAIDPATGAVHVAWRQFGLSATAADAIMVATSAGPGKGFGSARKMHQFRTGGKGKQLLKKLRRGHRMGEAEELEAISPFDSSTADDRFRTNAYPTMAVDDQSRVYVAWTERGYGRLRPDPVNGDARIVLSTSLAGGLWSTPQPVDNGAAGADWPGHQMMPSMAYAGGRLMMVYYDLREDVSQVFGPFVDENDAIATANRRHTIDLRAVQAAKGNSPVFAPSTVVSQYLVGNLRGSTDVRQLQFNAPNLPLFQLGSVPFMGDYIDIAPAPAFVKSASGQWSFNTASTTAPVFHAVWTDNRDVHKPSDGDWKNYTPPGGATCSPGQTGMRNQNIYSARLTLGLVTGSPGNTKPLDPTRPRAFVVFAQNTSFGVKSFRLTIPSQPAGGKASFDQLGLTPASPLLTSVDVRIPARSMISRTVYATSSNPKTQVAVDVVEIDVPLSGSPIAGGLASRVVLNPDISNPDISNPDISNPDISNPDISNAEVYNPDISNPDISNPDISNPDISNPDISNPDISNVLIANPDISNPDISNPDISNPDISNPDISNPDISNPDISNGSLTDVTWKITNTGNTTAAFNVNLFIANQNAAAGGIKTQLIVHKTYTTPISNGCTLASETQTVLVSNVLNPTFKSAGDSTEFDPANPDISNTTLWLEPGGEGKITLRIVDPDPTDAFSVNPVTDVAPVVQSLAVNTETLDDPTPEPPSTPLPTDPQPVPATVLTFVAQPMDTLAGAPMAPITVSAVAGASLAPGVQVTLAIAVNPSGGKLSGIVTTLTDAAGLATFAGLSIDRDGVGYRFSASASAAGALPVLSNMFGVGAPTSPFVVTTVADSGAGSLRAAIDAANATPVQDTITFSIPGAGEHIIQPLSALPVISSPLVIDATTQPGYDGRPVIRVHGAGLATRGFEIWAPSTVRGLAVSGFAGQPGVLVMNGAAGSVVEQSHVGTDRTGATGIGNGTGVQLNYASGVVVRQNLLSGNAGSGVLVVGGVGNQILDNRLGTGLDGFGALPNGDNGITLYDGSSNTIIDGNIISGNGTIGAGNGFGIDLQQSGGLADVTNTVITNNVIGLDANGDLVVRGAVDWIGPGGAPNAGPVDRGNAGGGIRLNRGTGTVIGQPGAGNTISGNRSSGVVITGPVAVPPVLRANRIGTDPTGTAVRANRRGIEVVSSAATIGTAGAGNGNLISGNLSDGVLANGNTTIENNLVGVDVSGTVAMGNGNLQDGGTPASIGCCHTSIFVGAPGNVVRGNVVGGTNGHSQYPGIRSGGAAGQAPNLIEDNFVGTDVSGTVALGNGIGIGLYGDKSGTVVRRNLIAFNETVGLWMVEGTEGALIGGEAVDGNTIRNNGAGIIVGYDPVASDTGNSLLSNLIFGNTNLGIDLGWNGVTPDDVGDSDIGPNGLQNFGVLSNVDVTGATTEVDITVDTDTTNTNYEIQIFANTACHASGFGQGQRLVGAFTRSSDGAADIVATLTLTESVPMGQWLTATVTQVSTGNTSEFSQCVEVQAAVTITSASPANGAPNEGFMVFRGANLPAGFGDVVAEVSDGVTTMNGFWFSSSSSSTAAYVRLPGMPLGPATVQLRNNAGTVVSNAFPITITAVPGTPVITAIRDGSLNVVAAPVPAGAVIYVGADGIDTLGAMVRFTQGANTWDVTGPATSNTAIGLALQVNLPGAASAGPIDVSIRQGASAFSAVVTIQVAAPPTFVSPVGTR
jgi:hypothetical protein